MTLKEKEKMKEQQIIQLQQAMKFGRWYNMSDGNKMLTYSSQRIYFIWDDEQDMWYLKVEE